MSEQSIPPDDWDTFGEHAWWAWRAYTNIQDLASWDSAPRCEETAEIFRRHGCTSVLDVASGFGRKTFQFDRLVFETAGVDSAPTAAKRGRELADLLEVDIAFHQMAWSELPGEFAGRFDAVYNDNIVNPATTEELASLASATCACLTSGGVTLLGSRPKEEWHMTPEERVEARRNGPEFGQWWDVETPIGQTKTIAMKARFPNGIYQHFFHLTNGTGVAHSGWYNNLDWNLSHYERAFLDAGLKSVDLIELPSGEFEGIASK